MCGSAASKNGCGVPASSMRTTRPASPVALSFQPRVTLVAVLVLLAVVAYRGPLLLEMPGWGLGKTRRFPILVVIAGVAVFLLLLSGSYVTITGAFGACSEWPTCLSDNAFPGERLQVINMFHRYVAAGVGLFVLYSLHLGFRGRTQPKEIRIFSMAAVALFVAQVLVGAVVVFGDFSQDMRALHLAMATSVWIAVSALAVMTFSSPDTRWGGVTDG